MRPLAGRKVVISAGFTREPLGNWGFIAGRSKGKEGFAFAEAAVSLGAETILVSGSSDLPIPQGAQLLMADTAGSLAETIEGELPCDITIHAAGVSPWRPDDASQQRLLEMPETDKVEVTLVRTLDLLKALGTRTSKRPALVVGLLLDESMYGSNVARRGSRIPDATSSRPGKVAVGPNWLPPTGTPLRLSARRVRRHGAASLHANSRSA